MDDVGVVNKITNIISGDLKINIAAMTIESKEGLFEGQRALRRKHLRRGQDTQADSRVAQATQQRQHRGRTQRAQIHTDWAFPARRAGAPDGSRAARHVRP